MSHHRTLSIPVVFLLIASFLLGGCSQVAGVSITATMPPTPVPPTATALPTATYTPVPTDTPTATPTASPSPTLDLKATEAANKAATAEAAKAAFASVLKEFDVDASTGRLVWADTSDVKQEVTAYLETANYVIKDAGQLDNFVMQSEIKWKTSGALSLCGFTFSAEDDLNTGAYDQIMLMRLQYNPLWTIWRWDNGQFQYHLANDWQESRDIHDENDSKNVLTLVVKGKDITVYINGDKQSRKMEDTKAKKGWLALSTYQESGKTTCTFTNTWIWSIDQ
jgi:hypothetical protein